MERPPQLGDLLVSVGVITKQQLAEALQYQRERGCMLGEALTHLHACTAEDIRGALDAQKRNTPLSDRLAVIKGRPTGPVSLDGASDLSWRYLQAFERELGTIAGDVRDVAQALVDLGLAIEAARKTVAANSEAAQETLSATWVHLKVITDELSHYAAELSPRPLEDGNLLVSLRHYASHYRRCYEGSLRLEVRGGDVRTSAHVGLGLFRALQVLLRGIGASENSRDVLLSLSADGGQVIVTAAFERICCRGAVGDPIGEMEERVHLLGGCVQRDADGDYLILTYRVPAGTAPHGPLGIPIMVS